MTLETFLEKLEQTPRDWRLLRGHFIRRAKMQCPVSCLLDKEAFEWRLVAEVVGLSRKDAIQVANAADDEFTDSAEIELRAKLLKACGLAAA